MLELVRRHQRRQRHAVQRSGVGGRCRGEERDHRRRGRGHQRPGFTLYSFAPDTATTSKCSGPCAQIWPPLTGPVAAAQGVTGKLGTITRSDGSKQATYDGHPLYSYTADTTPGQANGNNLNLNGGIWHEVTVAS